MQTIFTAKQAQALIVSGVIGGGMTATEAVAFALSKGWALHWELQQDRAPAVEAWQGADRDPANQRTFATLDALVAFVKRQGEAVGVERVPCRVVY